MQRKTLYKQYKKLGISSKSNGFKTYLHILSIRKKDFKKWNIITVQALV